MVCNLFAEGHLDTNYTSGLNEAKSYVQAGAFDAYLPRKKASDSAKSPKEPSKFPIDPPVRVSSKAGRKTNRNLAADNSGQPAGKCSVCGLAGHKRNGNCKFQRGLGDKVSSVDMLSKDFLRSSVALLDSHPTAIVLRNKVASHVALQIKAVRLVNAELLVTLQGFAKDMVHQEVYEVHENTLFNWFQVQKQPLVYLKVLYVSIIFTSNFFRFIQLI